MPIGNSAVTGNVPDYGPNLFIPMPGPDQPGFVLTAEGAGATPNWQPPGIPVVMTVTADASNHITFDLSIATLFIVNLNSSSSSWTIVNPINVQGEGQTFKVRLNQDGVGSRTLAGWGNKFNWGTGNSAPVLTTGVANVTDILAFEYNSSKTAPYCSLGAGFPQGY